jgi:hypothetical protein
MGMAMMQVRPMRMAVPHGRVGMRMGVPFPGLHSRVGMEMVRVIMGMRVGMLHGFVRMLMMMPVPEQQSEPGDLKRSGCRLIGRDRFAQP